MSVHPLYLDFFRFLDQLPKDDPWPSYRRLYLNRHEKFFAAYRSTFSYLDEEQMAGRVRQIKEGDYGLLRSLIRSRDPGELAEESLVRCRSVLPLAAEPPLFLFVGFFSADGSTIEVEGVPSIALGLERFRDFKDLPLLVAHEYGHCIQRGPAKDLFPEADRSLQQAVMREGLAVLFTERVYPEIPLHRHLFLTPERLHWGRENREVLLELATADLSSEKLLPVLFGPGDPKSGLPPRMGYYVAREMLRHCIVHHGAEEFERSFPAFAPLFQRVEGEGREA